jgi:CheY-like chemotaxis protein
VPSLITDVGLPGLNGKQVADAARLNRPKLKVVFITGYAANAVVGHGHLELGMQVITKPFAMDASERRFGKRNRIWSLVGGKQFTSGRDMTCYNGSPDVDFAKAAVAFGVEGEVITEPAKIQGALSRAKRANVEGRPYLLDIHVDREGIGAASEWHPPYSIAAQRTRKV